MAAAQKPQWVESSSGWSDDDSDKVVEIIRAESSVDRFHNHEDLSPEGMARAIADLQASMESAHDRLTATETATAGAAQAAKDLGASMFKMGDSVARRVKTVEDAQVAQQEAAQAAAAAEKARNAAIAERRTSDQRMVMVALAVAVVAAAAAGAAWFAPHGQAQHVPGPVLNSPAASQ